MTIIEYELNSGKPTIPTYVTDGGYWQNPDDKKLIGVGLEGSIPDSVETFTLEELQTRQVAINAKYPMIQPFHDEENNIHNHKEMTDDEVNASVKAWWDAR